jgi:hypothetical protein
MQKQKTSKFRNKNRPNLEIKHVQIRKKVVSLQ